VLAYTIVYAKEGQVTRYAANRKNIYE
jgi:hypothetical protein